MTWTMTETTTLLVMVDGHAISVPDVVSVTPTESDPDETCKCIVSFRNGDDLMLSVPVHKVMEAFRNGMRQQ